MLNVVYAINRGDLVLSPAVLVRFFNTSCIYLSNTSCVYYSSAECIISANASSVLFRRVLSSHSDMNLRIRVCVRSISLLCSHWLIHHLCNWLGRLTSVPLNRTMQWAYKYPAYACSISVVIVATVICIVMNLQCFVVTGIQFHSTVPNGPVGGAAR